MSVGARDLNSGKSFLLWFPVSLNTIAEFSRDLRSGILINEIKSPESRRIDRFTGLQIPTAEP
jgi:hypothetical protein